MYEAYCRIFDRCGVPYVIVEAESGPIGGDSSHEFMVPCSTGEDKVIFSAASAGTRPTRSGPRSAATTTPSHAPDAAAPAYEAVPTPSKRTIREVCEFLGVDEPTSAKLLVYLADGKPAAALLRGDHELNEAKFRRAVGATSVAPADAADDREGHRRPDGLPRAGRDQDPDGHRPGDRRDADGRRRRQRGRCPLQGRRAGPRLSARAASTTSATPTPAIPAPAAAHRSRSSRAWRSATSSSSGPSIPSRWARAISTRRGTRSDIIMGCYGIGINRIVAGGRRGGPRRQRHPLAAGARPLSGRWSCRSRSRTRP